MARSTLSFLRIPGALCRACAACALLLALVCPSLALEPPHRPHTWAVAWDADQGLSEWGQSSGVFGALHVFAASFNEEGKVVLAPQWQERLKSLPPPAKNSPNAARRVLTVVNDIARSAGTTLKDPGIVHGVVADAAAREAHIQELANLAESLGFDDLEIDYENVAEADWPSFLEFCSQLHSSLASRGMRLSVLLEPKKKYFRSPFPPQLRFTIMGYNLFGGHSGPGPKATPGFLAGLADMARTAGILDRCSLAMATGGFDWSPGRKAAGLTQAQAEKKVRELGLSPQRNESDGYLVCRYTTADGHPGELWYADAQTLELLWRSARAAGFGSLSIWRLGGNSSALFDILRHDR